MEGRGVGNVNVPILMSNNFNEFQALMQEIKSQGMIMSSFMEEMKQQSQSNLENLRERGQPRQEVASKPERQFSNGLGGQHSENLREASEFHHPPMQVETRYLPPHKREGDTLENVAGERPNEARLLKLIKLHNLKHMKGLFFQWRLGGHHVAFCMSEWQ